MRDKVPRNLTGPRVSTIKKLFAVCGNECAFPACAAAAFDHISKETYVEICHIKGRRPDAPRYDRGQNDEERHGFENMILLCGHHHNVIDSDLETYTVEALLEMKALHESQPREAEVGADDADNAVTQLITDYVAVSVYADTVIWSEGQLGGQIAKTIINEQRPVWGPTAAALARLQAELEKLPPSECDLYHIQGDSESTSLAHRLRIALESAGWTVRGFSMLGPQQRPSMQIGFAPRPGQDIPAPVASLVTFLWKSGLIHEPTIIPDPSCTTLKVVIGHRPEAQ